MPAIGAGAAIEVDVDPALVEQAQRGDRDAFAVLAAATIDRLYAIARVTLRDQDRAEDAVQETLVRCWRDLPSLREPERFEAWQRRTLMHAIADEFRRGRRYEAQVRVLHAEPSDPDAAAALADRDELDRRHDHDDAHPMGVVVGDSGARPALAAPAMRPRASWRGDPARSARSGTGPDPGPRARSGGRARARGR